MPLLGEIKGEELLKRFEEEKEEVMKVFRKHVKVAYLFGSVSRNDTGPLSDIDFAVLTDGKEDFYKVVEEISGILGNNVDVLDLKDASLLMKYNVLKEGKVVYSGDEKERVTFETKVLQEYLDRKDFLKKYARESLKRMAGET